MRNALDNEKSYSFLSSFLHNIVFKLILLLMLLKFLNTLSLHFYCIKFEVSLNKKTTLKGIELPIQWHRGALTTVLAPAPQGPQKDKYSCLKIDLIFLLQYTWAGGGFSPLCYNKTWWRVPLSITTFTFKIFHNLRYPHTNRRAEVISSKVLEQKLRVILSLPGPNFEYMQL